MKFFLIPFWKAPGIDQSFKVGPVPWPMVRPLYHLKTKDPKAPEVQDGSLMQNYV